MKKYLSLLMMLMMSIAMSAEIKSGNCGTNVTYTLDTETGVLKIEGTGKMYDYSSSSLNDTYVTSAPWRNYYQTLKSVTISQGVTSIGSNAFRACSSLTSVTIPEGVTSIGNSAFSSCSSLTSITIPSSVTSIGSSAFQHCSSLTSVTIPEGVTSIGSSAFENCSSLTSVTIPSSVTSIGDWAFNGCSSLTSITIPEGVTSIGSGAFNGCSSLTSITIPDGVTSIGDLAFSGCSSLTSITIPDGVTSIGSGAFQSCSSLTSITIPEGVTSIGSYAFNDCFSLTYITIPSSVTSIGYGAFYGCSSLTSVTIPEGVTSIGDYAFYNCSLTSITIPEGVTSIGSYAFSGCSSLTKIFCEGATPAKVGGSSALAGTIYVPFGAKTTYASAQYWSSRTIREYAMVDGFYYTPVDGSNVSVLMYDYGEENSTSLTIPSSITAGGKTYNVTGIYQNAFKDNLALTAITFPNSIETMEGYAFSGCTNLKSVSLSRSLTSLPSYAFQNCSALESVTLPSGLTTIYSYAFDGCTSLQSVSIKAYCTFIATTAFNRCTSLAAFTVDESNTNYSTIDGVLTNKGKTQIVAYPGGKGTTYEIPASITTLGEYCFRGSMLTSITIPSTVANVYNYAFADCPSLKEVNIDSKTSSISLRNYIFQNSPVEKVTIDRPISNYSSTASYNSFYNHAELKSAVLGENVKSIYASMFYGCSSLTSVTILEGVTSIGGYAFQNCSSLTSITIPEGVTSIGYWAFYGCSSLPSIKIPATVTSIGDAFLSGCTSLSELYADMQTPPVLQATAFTGIDKNKCRLIVPAAYVETYSETPGWLSFNNIVAENDPSMRKVTVSLTDNGSISIGSRSYDCEGIHSLYVSSSEDVTVSLVPAPGFYLKSVKQNGHNVTSQMNGNNLTIARGNTEVSLEVNFTSITETTDIASLTYAVYPSEVTGVSGKQITLPLNLKNSNLIATWQADLVLPEGFTVATDEYEDPMITVSGTRTTASRHSIATSVLSSGAIRILYNSSSNKTISGTDGEVATITLNVAEDVEAGDYPIILKNLVMSEANETGHKVDQVVSKITVQSYTPGDVNNDGEINAQDLVAVVNYILETPAEGNIREAADLNEDGNIDAMDYVAEVNLILSDTPAASKTKAKTPRSSSTIYGTISLDPFTLKAGSEKEVVLSLQNLTSGVTSCQLDVMLPEGVRIADAESNIGTHSVAYRQLENGMTRILLLSPANKTIRQTGDGTIRLTLRADRQMTDGEYSLDVTQSMLVSADANGYNPAPASFTFTVGDATSIDTMAADAKASVRYNLSGQRVDKSRKGIVIMDGKKQVVR